MAIGIDRDWDGAFPLWALQAASIAPPLRALDAQLHRCLEPPADCRVPPLERPPRDLTRTLVRPGPYRHRHARLSYGVACARRVA